MESIFDGVEKGPPIEVFALNKLYLEDSSPDKVNLGVGGKFYYIYNHYVTLMILKVCLSNILLLH